MTAVLELNDIHKRFGRLDVLNGLCLVLDPGTLFGLVGINGSGKTTLLHVIAGAEVPDRGRILLGSRDIGSLPAWRRAAAGIARTFQSSRLWADLTVREHFFVAESARRHVGAKLEGILDRVGFPPALMNTFPGELRLLDRRRVEIALAMLLAPRVLLADEIGAGLNSEEARSLYGFLASMVRERHLRAAILVEHRLDLLVEFATEISLLSNGNIELRARVECPDEVRRLSDRMFAKPMRMLEAPESRIT